MSFPTHGPFGPERDKAEPVPPTLTQQAAAALPRHHTAPTAFVGLAFALLALAAGYLGFGLIAGALALPGLACSALAWRTSAARRLPIGVAVAGCLISTIIAVIVVARIVGAI